MNALSEARGSGAEATGSGDCALAAGATCISDVALAMGADGGATTETGTLVGVAGAAITAGR